MKIEKGKFENAETVTLGNTSGLNIKLCALGAGIMSITLPDKNGERCEVTRLTDRGYARDYNGMTIGRTSGRIENATFSIDGRTAVLEKNNKGVDNLHGGGTGLHTKVFTVKTKENAEYTDVVFDCSCADGEGGYFGNVDITVTYRVYENENKFAIMFFGKPDSKTLLNLTNHVYWDMSGNRRQAVTEQDVFLNAPRVGVLDERLIVRDIIDVPPQFDFTHAHKMGDHLKDASVQRHTLGYDHPFFLAERGLDKLACSLYSPLSGLKLEVRTTYPCVVVFGDNFGEYKSTCFECQYHPDGIHACPNDCGVCTPDKPYDEVIEYTFSVE